MDKEGVSIRQWRIAHPAGAQVPAGREKVMELWGGGAAALPRGGSRTLPDPCLTLCVV